MPNVVEYIYYFNEDWDNPTVVAAGPDGRATFTFTPAAPGFYPMQVFARAADGTLSANSREYDFMVNSAP
jgi:hypothetical protein